VATLLGEIRPDPREPLVGEISARIAAGEVEAARDLAQAGVRARPDGVQTWDLLIAALDHLGEAERALDGCVCNAARRLSRLRSRPGGGGGPGRLDPERRVFVAGYFKSGSSAVLDHLRGFEGVTKWTPRGEMRLVKSPGGMADLAKRHQERGGLCTADLVDFYLHITGWKITLTPPGRYHLREVVNRTSAALFGSPAAAGYLRCCLECFLELARRPGRSVADLERQFRGWVERALDAVATDTGADLVLVDQAVNAWRLAISRFLPPSTFVIVHRDPRDHFADARLVRQRPGRKPLTVESFARHYRARRERVEHQVPEIARRFGHRALTMSFEDFVLDHETQASRLRDFLGLGGRAYRNGHYEPARGLDGIGRHTRLITPEEAATLVDALPEYLDKRAATW
jgi:hypothetical protein